MSHTKTYLFETKINGRNVTRHTELSFKGKPGRYKFIRVVTPAEGKPWVDCVGGRTGYAQWRSFWLEDVKTVHSISKLRR